jgi:STE24 endopeptidase
MCRPVALAALLFITMPAVLTVDPAMGVYVLDSPTADSISSAAVSVLATSHSRRDYLSEMRAAFGPDDRAYWGIKTALRLIEPLASVLISLLILFSGLAAKIRDVAINLGRSRWVQLLVVLTLYTLLAYALTFPMIWYDTFALEHQYQLSNQGFAGWLGDQGKALMVGIVFLGVVPILWLVYTAIARSPRRWWLWLGLGTLPLIVAATLIEPLVVDPLFNKFAPLQDHKLEARILDLAERAGIPGRKVYQVDKSAQTKKYNAYVNGFGVSQRIVLWDTTLQGMEEDEILFVTGHEIGHYALGHIWRGIAITSAASLLLFWITARIAGWAVRRFGDAWGFDHLADPASLPLLAATLTLVVTVSQPVIHSVSRSIEREADIYGLEITRDNDAAARAFMKLGAQNRSNPEPPAWVRFWLYSHPTLSERVTLASSYRPWEEERANRFYHGR